MDIFWANGFLKIWDVKDIWRLNSVTCIQILMFSKKHVISQETLWLTMDILYQGAIIFVTVWVLGLFNSSHSYLKGLIILFFGINI